MRRVYDVCVIGGGLAGLTLAYYLLRLDGSLRIAVLERKEKAGGLLRSETVGGFTFDLGGSHILFSKNRELLGEILGIVKDYLTHRRAAKIRYGGRFIKYPFENGLKDLPPEERYECLRELVFAYIKRVRGEVPEPSNFLEWIYYVFGKAIAEKYLVPYNLKLWKTDLRKITLEWVGGRVPNPPLDDVIKSAVGLETEGYKHQLIFHYPRVGGIEALINNLISELSSYPNFTLKLGAEPRKISILDKGLALEVSKEGEVRDYFCKAVVYTGALTELPPLIEGWSRSEFRDLRNLRAVPLGVVALGIEGEAPPYHWVYFPSDDVIFHRIAFISNFSPHNAPKGHFSLIAEASFKSWEELRNYPKERLVREVVEGLETHGIARSGKVVVSYVKKWRKAYVVYDKLRSNLVSRVKEYLRSSGIFLHGRFAEWEYLNMDAVFQKSKDLSREVLIYVKKVAV